MKRASHTYSVLLTPAEEGGFTVTVPALPGCITEGDTYEEAMKNVREAIELTIESLEARGDTIPQEHAPSVMSTVTVSDGQYA